MSDVQQEIETATKEFAGLVYSIAEHTDEVIPCGCVGDEAKPSRVFFLLEGCLIMAFIYRHESGTIYVSLNGDDWENVPHSTGFCIPTRQTIGLTPYLYNTAKIIGHMVGNDASRIHTTLEHMPIPYVDIIGIAICFVTSNIPGITMHDLLGHAGIEGMFVLDVDLDGHVVVKYNPNVAGYQQQPQYLNGNPWFPDPKPYGEDFVVFLRFKKPTPELRRTDYAAPLLCDKIQSINKGLIKKQKFAQDKVPTSSKQDEG